MMSYISCSGDCALSSLSTASILSLSSWTFSLTLLLKTRSGFPTAV